jgi:hypothetical protein
MGSNDNAAARTKLPRHSRESGNPAGQSKGLGPSSAGMTGWRNQPHRHHQASAAPSVSAAQMRPAMCFRSQMHWLVTA